jgi:hypothetical protein
VLVIGLSFQNFSHDLHDSIALNQKELGVGPCLAADVWGENDISLLGVLGYLVDTSFALHEQLLMCEALQRGMYGSK